ncbi:hypothetical protein Leryth_002641 [Lithospermum erythrorhizon]|nr:hypothetical protein Leryth_002641 [Lithospermum erythrorhizon]
MSPTTTSATAYGGAKLQTFDDFVTVHGILLAASGVPKSLHRLLYQKLTSEAFDGGDYFQVEQVEDGRQRRLVCLKESIGKDSNVFLVDHAWTFRLADAFNQLQEVPGLAERMAAMMCVDVETFQDEEKPAKEESNEKFDAMEIVMREVSKSKEEGADAVRWLELDELEIDDSMLVSLDIPSKFPNLLALSLYGNKLEDVEVVSKEITQLKNLRALWLNDNPIVKNGDGHLAEAILQGCPNLEIYNSKFTQNFGEFALGFCGGIYEKDNPGYPKSSDHSLRIITSLDLSNRDIHNLINKAFTPVELPTLSYLNLRGNPIDENSFDELVNLLKGFNSLESLEVDIPGPLGDSAVDILESLPRILLLNGVEASQVLETEKVVIDSVLQPRFPEWVAGEPLPHRVIRAMWLYLMTYRLADEEKIDETSIWYVMDELGSALRHSDKPNFRVAPFLFMPDGTLDSALRFSSLSI